MGTEIDPAIKAATPAATPDSMADSTPGARAIDPLSKDGEALLISDPANPRHALYTQAVQALELLGQQKFKDRRELERVALAIAMQADAAGLSRIDRIVVSDDGAGYFFVDAHAVDPAMRGYVSHVEAAKPVDRQAIEQAQQQRVAQEQQRRQVEQDQAKQPPKQMAPDLSKII